MFGGGDSQFFPLPALYPGWMYEVYIPLSKPAPLPQGVIEPDALPPGAELPPPVPVLPEPAPKLEKPAALEIESDAGGPLRDETLTRLYRDCRAQLEDPDLDFEPLLPASDAPVERRAEALVEWCRGFLGGVGLSGTPTALFSADANEVLADIGRIAASHFDYDDAEEDESALSEVLEFVRVGVLLLHTELTKPRAAAGRSVH
jgi:uncharacterized protein YgfB (UPF0149 family)